ncbi:MAG: ferrous iron transport protein B [Candidatus Micrarchaeota archaeon]
MGYCCKPRSGSGSARDGAEKIRIALAGNSNVGKSALFNCLTGMSQHVANWPGKTVELAEGRLRFGKYDMEITDLPGIYSFSTFSIEERVSEEYIMEEKPDVVVNVVDSTALERNLFFTLQLLELGVPVVIALNQTDAAKKRGIAIDEKKLGSLLGVPVVSTVATKGLGVQKLVVCCIGLAKSRKASKGKIRYGKEVEAGIGNLEAMLEGRELGYPARYAAIRLLESGGASIGYADNRDKELAEKARRLSEEVGRIHGEPASIVMSNERYTVASETAADVQSLTKGGEALAERIDELTTHRVLGYLIMLLVLGGVFYAIFAFGGFLSASISDFFNMFRPAGASLSDNLVWEGLVGGFVAGLTLVLPYVLPFYFLLSLLEDTGYITRVAYLLDGLAHRIGFHGKAIIPLLLGYGCNVPACIGCRIMEYERDRLITAFAVTLVPCTARMVVILTLVAAFLGIWWAAAIYIGNLVLIAMLAKVAFKVLPGEPVGLIMEMPRYRLPSLKSVAKQTVFRTKSLLTIVFPYYIGGGLVLALLQLSGVLALLNNLFQPVIVGWMGLPAITGTLLIFGIVRKEFIVVLPSVLYGTANLALIFTPLQMVVLASVAMLYIPCFATIEALRREFGWKKALFITGFEIVLAIVLGGLIARLLPALGIL